MKSDRSVLGVGPIYVAFTGLLTFLGYLLDKRKIIPRPDLGPWSLIFTILGYLLIAIGLVQWVKANFQSKLVKHVKQGKLVTTGIYAYVRHPIYSAFFLSFTGVVLIIGNAYLYILPAIYWISLTLLVVQTEEKWLFSLYGNAYREYCEKTNRCIPWKRKNKGK